MCSAAVFVDVDDQRQPAVDAVVRGVRAGQRPGPSAGDRPSGIDRGQHRAGISGQPVDRPRHRRVRRDAKTPQQAGWYRYSVRSGEDGPAILLGHVDGSGKPGIFHDLRKLKPGAEVVVTRADGSTVRFTVTQVQEIPRANFPTEGFMAISTRPSFD
jgi:hypothetical protein